VVVCEDKKHLAKFLEILQDEAAVPDLTHIVMWTGDVPEEAAGHRCEIITWKDFMAMSAHVEDAAIQERINAQRPGHPCTLIYTSGTTGNPKAVMITHDNLVWTARATIDWLAMTGTGFGTAGAETSISYLPLSHIAAQMLDIHFPIALASHELLPGWGEVVCARPDAMKGTIKFTMQQVAPTLFFGVPRVWEKFQEAIEGQMRNTTGIKAMAADWARGRGLSKHTNAQVNAKDHSNPWFYGLAQGLVFGKVKAGLGLQDTKVFFSAAAPIAKSTLEFFGSLDIHIWEIYGMSECTGPQTVAAPGFFQVGTVGHSLPGCELGILQVPTEQEIAENPDAVPRPAAPGEEAEICFRGRHVMLGYMGEGMEAKTAEAIDQWGWLHSGDKGRVDAKGLLHITGRYKELLITAGGENVAPIPIETAIKDALPGIVESVIMVADKRKFCSVLFVLKSKPGMNEQDQPTATEELFLESAVIDPDCKTIGDACGEGYAGSPKWKAALFEGIKVYNANPVSQATKINAFKICRDGVSVGNGLMTDTMKMKRSKVYAKHGPLIEYMYAEADLGMATSAAKKAAETDKATAEEELEAAKAAFEQAKAILDKEYCPTGGSATDF